MLQLPDQSQVHFTELDSDTIFILRVIMQAMLVSLRSRPPVAFDVLSVDIGITPSKLVPGSSSIATPVKPISG